MPDWCWRRTIEPASSKSSQKYLIFVNHREFYSVKWRRKCGRGMFLLRKSKLSRRQNCLSRFARGRGREEDEAHPRTGQRERLEGREERLRETGREGGCKEGERDRQTD